MLAILAMKDEWRCTITVHGELFVMMGGTSTMLVLSAERLVFKMLRLLCVALILAKGLDRFGLTKLIVQVMSHRYIHAPIAKLQFTTVITLKTQGYAVVKAKIRQYC